MKKFSEKDPVEKVFVLFDFSKLITDSTEGISTATVTSTSTTGLDSNPSSMISGSATISAKTVTQLIIGGVDNETYTLTCIVDTTKGQRFKALGALPVLTQT